MKKVFFIIGLSLIATVGLSGCFGPFKKDAEENQTASQTEDAETFEAIEDKEESFFGSMQDLIDRGKSLKCAYKLDGQDGGEGEVVMYIAGGKVRTETEINADGSKKIKSDMIIDKDWMYMWNSFTPDGMKMDMQKMPEMDDAPDNDVNNEDMANLAKEMDYKCRAWIPDSDKFKIPTDVKFNDITNMMSGAMETIADMDEGDMDDLQNKANKFLCDFCKNEPTPELVAECLGDVVCD